MGDDQRMPLSRIALWLGIIGFPVAVVSLVLWFPWYWPTVSVRASSEAVDPLAGMPLSFSIENEGVLQAHSAKYRCYFGHVRTLLPLQVIFDDNEIGELPVADVLLFHDPVEVSCTRLISAPDNSVRVVEADVAILVSFRPSFDWRRSSACGRYILRKNAGNQLAWFRKSSAPCKELAECLDRRVTARRLYRHDLGEFIKNGSHGQSPEAPQLISCLPKE